MKGELGQPPGGLASGGPAEGAEGSPADHGTPRVAPPAADLDSERKTAGEKLGDTADDRALASYLMYPKVFSDFAVAQENYGPTEVLPTPT